MRLSDDNNRFLSSTVLPSYPPQNVLPTSNSNQEHTISSTMPTNTSDSQQERLSNCCLWTIPVSNPGLVNGDTLPVSVNDNHNVLCELKSSEQRCHSLPVSNNNGTENNYYAIESNRDSTSLFARSVPRSLRGLHPRSLPTPMPRIHIESLPSYQSRQSQMMRVLYEFETMPTYLVSGYIREIVMDSTIMVPQDLINLCLRFVQHAEMALLIDSKSNDQLYTMAWEATEKEEYLFAEQLIAYLLRNGARQRSHLNASNHFAKSAKGHKLRGMGRSSSHSHSHHNGNGVGDRDNNMNTEDPRRCSSSEDASTNNLMAVIKYFMKDYTASERFFQRASAIDPSCDIIMNNYAVLLLEEERFADAEEQIMRAIRCNPRCIKNHQQFAYILFTMGKYEEAAKECQLMIFLEPNIESYSGYAWLLEQMGRFEESCAQYRQLIALEPENAIWYYWYAVLLQRCDEYLLSRDHFAQCIRMDPQHEGANGNYAYSLYLNHEFEAAMKFIKVAIERDDCHLCVHYYYALLCVQRDDVQTAVNELYRCLELLRLHKSECKNEKGCLLIHEGDIHALLRQLGYL